MARRHFLTRGQCCLNGNPTKAMLVNGKGEMSVSEKRPCLNLSGQIGQLCNVFIIGDELASVSPYGRQGTSDL